nr:hypothetical protein [Bradyrhizobium campsiandrae]
MQFGNVVVARRIGHRKIAAISIRHQDLQILAGLEWRTEADRKAQVQDRDTRCRLDQPINPRRDGLAPEDIDALEALRANGQVGAWLGAAHQRGTVSDGPPSTATLFDFTVDQPRFAGVASALAA